MYMAPGDRLMYMELQQHMYIEVCYECRMFGGGGGKVVHMYVVVITGLRT